MQILLETVWRKRGRTEPEHADRDGRAADVFHAHGKARVLKTGTRNVQSEAPLSTEQAPDQAFHPQRQRQLPDTAEHTAFGQRALHGMNFMKKRAIGPVKPETQPAHGQIAIGFKTQAGLPRARVVIDAESTGGDSRTQENMDGHRGVPQVFRVVVPPYLNIKRQA
jgi:hypothetical protein